MDWEFDSNEDRQLRDSLRTLMAGEQGLLAQCLESGEFPRQCFADFAKMGLAALSVPEDEGGLGASAWTSALVFEEISRVHLGPAIFLSVHNMVTKLFSRFASAELKSRSLADLCSGKLLAAFALSEPQAGSDAAALQLRARDAGDCFVLQGEKAWITSAGHADVYLVFARTGAKDEKDSISAFLIEKNTAGLEVGKPEKKMGGELSPIASLFFRDAKVPKTQMLGEAGKGLRIALSGLESGRVNIAACANGISLSALGRALEHMKSRKQFGRALVEFQGLQFMLADMQIQLDAARLLTWRATQSLDRGRFAKLHAAEAKCFATDTCMNICTNAVQLCGALGYMKEFGLEQKMRDAKMLQIVEGANQVQRMIVAGEICT